MSCLNRNQICEAFAKLMLPYSACVWLGDCKHDLHFELFLSKDKCCGELPISELDTLEKLKVQVRCFQTCLSLIERLKNGNDG